MFVRQLDVPDVGAAPDVQGARCACDPARSGAAQVVGIDVQTHGLLADWAGKSCAAGAQCFGQHHRHAAMQDALGLPCARIHWHAATDPVVSDLQELYAQLLRRSLVVDGGQYRHRQVLFPKFRSWSFT